MRRTILLPLLLVLAAACSSTSGTGASTGTTGAAGTGGGAPGTTGGTATRPITSGLVGPSWTLVSYQGPSGTTPASSSPAILTFEPGGVLSGTTGCNRIRGTYKVDGSNLTIDPGATTMMACADPAVDAQEQAVAQGLAKVRTFTVRQGQLTLQGEGGTTLFQLAAQPAGLTGTSWTATGVNNGRGAVQGTATTEQATLVFGDQGAVTGSTGCSQLAGTSTIDSGAGTMTFSGLTTSGGPCTGEAATFEQQYLAALGAVATYQREGSTLTLRDASGAMQATYRLAA